VEPAQPSAGRRLHRAASAACAGAPFDEGSKECREGLAAVKAPPPKSTRRASRCPFLPPSGPPFCLLPARILPPQTALSVRRSAPHAPPGDTSATTPSGSRDTPPRRARRRPAKLRRTARATHLQVPMPPPPRR